MKSYRDHLLAVIAALSVKENGFIFVLNQQAMTIALGNAQIFMETEYEPCPKATEVPQTEPA